MVKFFEGGGDFIDFGDGDDELGEALCTCNECGHEFLVDEAEEPDKCPSCGFEFDFGVEG